MESRITTPAIMDKLGAALRPYGFVANCLIVTPGDGINFSGKSATADEMRRSMKLLQGRLDATGAALPYHYVAQGDQLVHFCVGAGYPGDDTNPNPAGMGLVMCERLSNRGIAMATTWADAPAAVLVHAPTGLTASVSGIGHLLAKGTVTQTNSLLRQQVEDLGYRHLTRDLWVILSPGARHGFLVDQRMIDEKLHGIDPAILKEVIRENVGTEKQPHSLDLSLLFKKLWMAIGVPEEQIDFDERNTLTDEDLPSKRRADARGEPFYSSGVIAIVVHPIDE